MRTTSSWLAALAAAVAMMLVVGPALAFNANTVPNLTVWLKADAGVLTNSSGVVTTWLDQSGNGHNGANSLASSPTNPKYTNSAAQLGSQPALVFTHDGTGITLGNLGSSFPSAATLFVVASINDAGYNIFITKDSQTWWRYSGNGYAYPGAFRAGRIETYAIEPSTGAYIFQVESSASNWRMLTNGVSQGNYAASYSGGDNYRIGYGPDAGGFSGQIAEVLVYSRILSSNEQNQVGSYLAWKYSLPTTYPALPIISNRDATNVTATTAITSVGAAVRDTACTKEMR